MKSFDNFYKTARPLVYLITDGTLTDANFAEKSPRTLSIIEAAVRSDIALIQIREKQLSAKFLFELARRAVSIRAAAAENSASKILINDRADVALASNADGVHLTSVSVSPQTIRRAFPENFVVGVSVHSLEKALAAKRAGADFVTFSPVFHSPGKGAPQGIEALRQITEALGTFPVIALGGIDETNYREAAQVSAGFAAIRFLNDTENLRKFKK